MNLMKLFLVIFMLIWFHGFSQEHKSRQVIFKVIDSGDHQSISDAHVNVYSSTGSTEEFKSDSSGMVRYLVYSGNKYKVEALKEGFFTMHEGFLMETVSDTLTLTLKYTAGCTRNRLPEFRFERKKFKTKDAEMLYSMPKADDWNESIYFEIRGYNSLDEDTMLAMQRAQAVKQALIRANIPENRIVISTAVNTFPSFNYRETFKYKGVDYLFKEDTFITASQYNSFDKEKRELIDLLMRRVLMRIGKK
jgi:hypothetical protein